MVDCGLGASLFCAIVRMETWKSRTYVCLLGALGWPKLASRKRFCTARPFSPYNGSSGRLQNRHDPCSLLFFARAQSFS